MSYPLGTSDCSVVGNNSFVVHPLLFHLCHDDNVRQILLQCDVWSEYFLSLYHLHFGEVVAMTQTKFRRNQFQFEMVRKGITGVIYSSHQGYTVLLHKRKILEKTHNRYSIPL